jgi:acyl-CoA synthetase (NDP forming)
VERSNLSRLLAPATVAVVGASEKLGMSNNAVVPMLEAGVDVQLVNPNRDEVYGRPAAPSLSSLDHPVDAVLALVNAERSIDVVAEAAVLGCGGVVVAAGGFAELGASGRSLEDRLVAAAGPELAVVGPNCSGFVNVRQRANLFTGGRISLEPGGVAVVSQSGFLARSCLAAGRERQLGFSIAVSSGNEAVCGLADYLDVLADDPETRVICLVVEKVRTPGPFFAAVARARRAGKAVIALKLGRTAQSREILRTHTGAIADESWVYDAVLPPVGVLTAGDVDEMLDLAQLLAQLPPERWRPLRGVAVVASSGGVAGVAADAATAEGVDLPALDDLEPWVREKVPGGGAPNPLDMTGFVMRDRDLLEELFERYAHAAAVDALVLCWWAGEGDEAWSRTLLEPFAAVAGRSSVPLIVSPVEGTALGGWTKDLRKDGVVFCRGLRSTYRALRALDQVARAALPGSGATLATTPALVPATRPSPTARPALIETPAGPMVPFGAALRLLEDVGVPVAPYRILGPEAEAQAEAEAGMSELGDRLVVKLADVPHRTELDAVRTGVAPEDVPHVARDLRAIAEAHEVPATVVVQAMIDGHGEAFVGLHARADLGPIVLFGIGGVLVEVTGRVGGRLLPLAAGDAAALVEEVVGGADGRRRRGQRPWALAPLVDAVEAVGELWRRTGPWLDSADLNPLIVTDKGVVAVDALLIAAH